MTFDPIISHDYRAVYEASNSLKRQGMHREAEQCEHWARLIRELLYKTAKEDKPND